MYPGMTSAGKGRGASVAIASVGLATAQGSTCDIVRGASLRPATRLPWLRNKWTTCHLSYPAVGVEPTIYGGDRWSALARQALKDCFGDNEPPAGTRLLAASCNGVAGGFDPDSWRHAFDSQKLLSGTNWVNGNLPVFSASCTSGLHALYAAKRLLLAGCAADVVVLAADILSAANHDNFEVLRVLSDSPTPWQHTSSGFILGEAAVAIHLVRSDDPEGLPVPDGPTLGSDLEKHDGLWTLLSKLRPQDVALILGQGTGPFLSDKLELSALRASLSQTVPLATPLTHFGHTLGASGLLSLALAVLAWKRREMLPVLSMPARSAADGRQLFNGPPAHGHRLLTTCRAMSGACAVAAIGPAARFRPQHGERWHPAAEHGVVMHRLLRRIATEAVRYRPRVPPHLLLVRMDEPLLPEARACVGGRLLPSAVLELTPGFVPQLIARRWGFTDGALCLVGRDEGDKATREIAEACAESRLTVSRVNLRGGEDDRTIEWSA